MWHFLERPAPHIAAQVGALQTKFAAQSAGSAQLCRQAEVPSHA
jgi:hypothetical protein